MHSHQNNVDLLIQETSPNKNRSLKIHKFNPIYSSQKKIWLLFDDKTHDNRSTRPYPKVESF